MTDRRTFSCCLVGEGNLLIQCAEVLLATGNSVLAVSSPDPGMRRWASQKGIALASASDDLTAFFGRAPFDYLFSIVNHRVLSRDVLALPRRWAVNYHDGPLPRYAGIHATSWALLRREKSHGVSWHVMTEEIDAGDVLEQAVVPIDGRETALTLNLKCAEAAVAAFRTLVDGLQTGQVVPRAQDLSQRSLFKRHDQPPRGGLIDWRMDAHAIDALVRALDFGPYPNPLGTAKVLLGGIPHRVGALDVLDAPSRDLPGTVVAVSLEGVRVATGSFDVVLMELVAPDGRRLDPAELERASGLAAGTRLEHGDASLEKALVAFGAESARHEAHWVRALSSSVSPPLPFARPGGGVPAAPARLELPLSDALAAWKRSGGTVLELAVAAFAAFLARVCAADGIELGVSEIALRAQIAGIEPFVSPWVPLEVTPDLHAGASALGAHVDQVLALARRRRTFARDVLLRYPELSGRARSADGVPAFSACVLETGPGAPMPAPLAGALTLEVAPHDPAWSLVFHPGQFDPVALGHFADGFCAFARALAAGDSRPVGRLPVWTRDEATRVLREWNATARTLPDERVHRAFEAVARATPDAVAVQCGAECVSYREFDRRANALAHRLRAAGVGAGRRVGLCLERSIDLVIAQIAVLKAGGAFVPLDPSHPPDRLAWMAADAQIVALVTHSALRDVAPSEAAPFVLVTDEQPDAGGADAPPDAPCWPESLAYVIYTSGSTGRPKGVGVSHASLRNIAETARALQDLGPGTRVLQCTSIGFDVSVWEIFGTLLAGATLCVAPGRGVAVATEAARVLREDGVHVAVMSPSLLSTVGALELPALRVLMMGGERCPGELVRRWSAPDRKVLNGYGPTEATVFATIQVCDPAAKDDPPIGPPLPNTRAYVLDARGEPVPVGVVGELYLSGVAVARGYLGRPELTAVRFVPDPFSDEPGARMYRTGDLVRWRPEGTIDYLGRADGQIKIRGVRIEPGEVEAVLEEHPGVARAVVVLDRELAGGALVGYVARRAPAHPTSTELREYLAGRLPSQMVPAVVLVLDELPLNANGKIDRGALPAPRDLRSGAPSATPRSDLERSIADVWREVLGVDRVGLDDRFFDLGGHSLLLVRVHAALEQRLGRAFPIMDLLRHTTVATLAAHLAGEAPAGAGARSPALTSPARRDAGAGGVAIVGMACRFPGAGDVEAFWQNVRDGVESITFFSDEALRAAGVDAALLENPRYVRAAPVLAEADRFDAAFWGYTPREAALMDPQQRVALECAWAALEHAGYAPGSAALARTGVFVGAAMNTYLMANLYPNRRLMDSVGAAQIMVLNLPDAVSTRISYKLDLRGPSVTVQTACSTALVAVDRAVQSLRAGECDVALAGGARVNPPLGVGYLYHDGITAPDGHCRAFDARSQGTVLGDGVGIVVLKRLEDALRDGDTIYAVIKGSAVNNDGADKTGFTAPSVAGQSAVITEALARAGVGAGSVGYVEAHGTATPLGDPIEVTALTEAYRKHTARTGYCALGSVKTNIGHADAAAGAAGLIKAAMALRHRTIPASLHFERPNPRLELATSPFFVPTRAADWTADLASPRRAAVSAFGIGGTNAHVVLEEPPAAEPSGPGREFQLLVLSARTPAALEAATERLVAHFSNSHLHSAPLADAAYTLALGRRAFAHRRAIVCHDVADACAGLDPPDPARVFTSPGASPARREVTFMFPGGGAQYHGMGAGLYRSEPVFRALVDRCAAVLRPALGFDLAAAMYPPGDQATSGAARATLTSSPPAILASLFVVEYALARLWISWGLAPHTLIGHSLGEYVAACLSGVFTLEDALSIVLERGRLFDELSEGAMLSVPLPEAEVRTLLSPGVSLGAVNGPSLCLVSGEVDAIASLQSRLAERGVEARRLHAPRAGHSQMVEPILDRFERFVSRVPRHAPQLPFVSNVSGTWITAEQATDPAYWARHLRQTVRFADGLSAVLAGTPRVLIEVGPGRTLATLARQHPDARSARPEVVTSLRHPQEQRADEEVMLASLARAWVAGAEVDWSGFYASQRRRRVALPTYPFERARYWVDPPRAAATADASTELSFDSAPAATVAEPSAPRSLSTPYAAPRNDVERGLVALLQELLGVERVGVHDSFFDLGGSSILAVQYIARIQARFGVVLRLPDVVERPTAADLAAFVSAERKGAGGDRAWSPLVEIQRGRPGARPLFFVHPGGGGVLRYVELASKLGPEHRFVGLQARGLHADEEPFTDLREMAARYVAAIREAQPEGPYRLGGWSMGGTIAFEMALQIEAQGERVEHLVAVDAYPPGCYRPRAIDDDDLAAALLWAELAPVTRGERVGIEQLRALDPAARARAFAERLARDGLTADESQDYVRRLVRVGVAHLVALASYTPRGSLSCPLAFVQPSDTSNRAIAKMVEFDPTDRSYVDRWRPLVSHLEVCTLPGDHYSLVSEPGVRALAEYLAHKLRRDGA